MSSFPSVFISVASSSVSLVGHVTLLGWAVRSFPAIARRKKLLLALCPFVAVTPALMRYLLLRTLSPVASALLAASLFELMFVLASVVPLIFVRVVTKIKFRAAKKAPEVTAPPAPEPDANVGRRRAFEAIGGAAVMGTTGLVFGWGATVGRHDYQVREVPVRIPGLPKELDGYVIAQISDIHAGLFVGEREFRDAGDILRKIRPDLLVVTGDIVDMDARHAPPVARALADLAPRDGVFAILGNHDYYSGVDAVASVLRAADITLLVNDARIIRGGDGSGFALVGLDDAWARDYGGRGADLKRATASLPTDTPRILLAHQPRAFMHAAGKVALQLSGHTHGGQIRPADVFMRGFVAGRYERNGSTLYVNSGFGVAGPPARVGVPPEITKVILVAT